MNTGRTTWEKLEQSGVAKRKGIGKLEDLIMQKVNSRFIPAPAPARPLEYPVGSVVKYGDSLVKVIGCENGLHELEYAETGDWADNEVPASKLSPVAK